MRALLAVFGCVFFSGCAEGTVCAALGSPGIELSVSDAATHQSLDSESTVTITDLQRGDAPDATPVIRTIGGFPVAYSS